MFDIGGRSFKGLTNLSLPSWVWDWDRLHTHERFTVHDKTDIIWLRSVERGSCLHDGRGEIPTSRVSCRSSSLPNLHVTILHLRGLKLGSANLKSRISEKLWRSIHTNIVSTCLNLLELIHWTPTSPRAPFIQIGFRKESIWDFGPFS